MVFSLLTKSPASRSVLRGNPPIKILGLTEIGILFFVYCSLKTSCFFEIFYLRLRIPNICPKGFELADHEIRLLLQKFVVKIDRFVVGMHHTNDVHYCRAEANTSERNGEGSLYIHRRGGCSKRRLYPHPQNFITDRLCQTTFSFLGHVIRSDSEQGGDGTS